MILEDITERTCLQEVAEAVGPRVLAINAATRWLFPRPRRLPNSPSRNGLLRGSNSPSQELQGLLHLTPSKQIAHHRMTRMARARQPLVKARGAVPLMDEARAWPSASMDEVAQLSVVAAPFSFLQRNQAQMEALKDKAMISREEEALLDIIVTPLEILRATGEISLPNSLSKSSRLKWGTSKAHSKEASNQVTATVPQLTSL